ncbi:MAG TPA: CHAD domain-containing protein [Terriglobales bacterium]|nr:CHAD domain-containing protein [Terriglobales bacterium]
MLPALSRENRHTRQKKVGLAYWAERVLEECHKAAAGFAAEPVHDLRVAIRRCRSLADGFRSVDPDRGWKQMKRLVKPLFRSLGDLRDTQVMLEWVEKLSAPGDPLGESLAAALRQKEAELKAAAQGALASFDRKHWASLNAHLAKRTDRIPLEGLVFQHLALERWLEARELHRRALRNRSSIGYHQLRIGIKRFRYTVENFLPQRHERWGRELRQLQDALGEVHDLDVLRGIIRAHSKVTAEEQLRWQKRVAEERQARLDLYRQKMLGKHSLWHTWRSELPSGKRLEDAGLEKLRSWASFLDPDVAHTARVTQFALQLYDGLAHCGVLVPRAEDRRILQTAAILHEVGRDHVDGPRGGHQKRGQRLVAKLTPPVGWSEERMLCVAALVRYHRGALPVASNSSFVGLSAKRRGELMPLIGILRLADALDDAHEGAISSVAVERQSGFVVVYGKGLRRISRAAERAARARYLLETTTRLPILVRPMPASAVSRQAGRRLAAVPSTGNAS